MIVLKKYIVFIVILLLPFNVIKSQINGDECENAIELSDVEDWCSENGEFSNIGATPSGYGTPDCWDTIDNDIWFRFTAVATAVTINISGTGPDGTISKPLAQLYTDNACYGTIYGTKCEKDNTNTGDLELNSGALIIGQSYLLRVDAENGITGTFKLCIKNFFPPIVPGQDCPTASLLCDKSPFTINSTEGPGNLTNETDGTCISAEEQSTWFKWIAKNDGTLTFTITPNQLSDDLDFVLYELPGGIDDCDSRVVLRCNATFGGNYVDCGPKTGLSLLSTDIVEDANCDFGEDGFVKYINMQEGTAYALVINNWTSSGKGFYIEFGGTGEFQGPIPDFTFDPISGLRCEDSITFIDNTDYQLGTISEYSWVFGTDAIPQSSNESSPPKVFYDSYGWKSVVLSVTSDKGCNAYVVKDIWMEPCCEDLPENESINIVVDSIKNPTCYGDSDGFIFISGIRGDPYYRYSINDTNFNYNPWFYNLPAGKYLLYIVDKKGCRDSIYVDLTDDNIIIADAGPDKTIELGESTTLDGDYTSVYNDVSYYWTPNYNLVDSFDLRPTATPYKTTTYTLTVTQDSTGCTDQDQMTVFIVKNRQVKIPNIFSPNGDGYNDWFTAFNVKAAVEIEEMQIFDRWGELIYENKNIPLDDLQSGWNGKFKGQTVNPGVYVYLFKIRFLDDEVLNFAGDITVLH
ncbi:MAG: gliding motility-associated C-terminal domain-containing protein [Saprospiraceae bacterium]